MKALLFPGEGSQIVGMGVEFYNNFKKVKNLFQEADESLKFKISKIILDGPESELKLTKNTQPAILTVSFSIYNILGKKIFEQIAYNIEKGTNIFLWNGRDFNKQEVATGMYFVQLEQNTTIHNQKIIFMK